MQKPFQKKLFASISLFIAVLVLVCILIFSVFTYQNLYQQSSSGLYQLSEHTASELDSLFSTMDTLALYASTNSQIREAFTDIRLGTYTASLLEKEVLQTLVTVSVPSSSSHFRISLYNRNGVFVSIGIPHQSTAANERLVSDDFSQWYDSLPVTSGGASLYGFHEDFWSGNDTLFLSLFREIYDKNSASSPTALVEIQVPYSYIQSVLQFDSESYHCYLYDGDGALIYPFKDDTVSEYLFDIFQEDPLGQLSGTSQLLYSGVTVNDSLFLILTQENGFLSILLPQILAILFIGIASLIFCLVILNLVTKQAVRPLLELTKSVEQVSLSNLSLKVYFSDYPDEFEGLNDAFKKMFQRLKQSMNEVEQMQACELRANMIALQAQMNPHFLYNTLSVIKALAHEGNMDQISLTCNYLTRMLRYISSYDESTVSLQQELDHTENYLNLMKIRYEDQFTWYFSIDSSADTSALKLPRLTLQPLVENCFRHGFQSVSPPWNIQIRFWLDGFRWYISVTDNGAGISAEKQEELSAQIRETLSHLSDSIQSLKIDGMGLINTIIRLKLAYKDRISFQIISPADNGSGTTILIGGILGNEYLCD